MDNIVLDTNVLVMSISPKSSYRKIWDGFMRGEYVLCISNEIIEEYAEMLARLVNPSVSDYIIDAILTRDNIRLVEPHFRWRLIVGDHDDDKFVDCAFAANATYIVSNDKHYDVLKEIDFPKILVLKLQEFLGLLQSEKDNKV